MLAYAGTAVAIGVPPVPSDVLLPWSGTDGAAYPNKASLLITDGGDPIPSEDFPQMAGWYLDGRLDLDAMVTRTLGHRRTGRGVPRHARQARSSVPSSGSTTSERTGVASAACERPSSTRGGRSCRPWPTPRCARLPGPRRRGQERAGEGSAIIAFNHVSVIDGPAVGIVVARKCRRRSRFLVAAEIFDKRCRDGSSDSFDQIPIRRGQGDVHALDEAISTVKAARSRRSLPRAASTTTGPPRCCGSIAASLGWRSRPGRRSCPSGSGGRRCGGRGAVAATGSRGVPARVRVRRDRGPHGDPGEAEDLRRSRNRSGTRNRGAGRARHARITEGG